MEVPKLQKSCLLLMHETQETQPSCLRYKTIHSLRMMGINTRIYSMKSMHCKTIGLEMLIVHSTVLKLASLNIECLLLIKTMWIFLKQNCKAWRKLFRWTTLIWLIHKEVLLETRNYEKIRARKVNCFIQELNQSIPTLHHRIPKLMCIQSSLWLSSRSDHSHMWSNEWS
jgi:hypothetical protein